MPNWCHNQLTIRGERTAVERFTKRSRGRPPVYADDTARSHFQLLTFSAMVPPPPAVLAAGYNDAGYRWQWKHWGSKWEPTDVMLHDHGDRVVYTFDTAWSPPMAWLKTVVARFSTLGFELAFSDPGAGQKGRVVLAPSDSTVAV